MRFRNCHAAIELYDARLDQMLVTFWNADYIPQQKQWTPEEQRAEDIFVKTHRRDQSGRFVVRIPLENTATQLGDSRRAAKACFLSVERKLQKNPTLFAQYRAVFDDYRSGRHMTLAPARPVVEAESYYLPPHAINIAAQPGDQRKFREVFNASAPSSNGISFNDLQLAGPKLQDDLTSIFMRFRTWQFGMTADIQQMFRQVNVNSLDWNFQRVFWRDAPFDELSEYIIGTGASYICYRCATAYAHRLTKHFVGFLF